MLGTACFRSEQDLPCKYLAHTELGSIHVKIAKLLKHAKCPETDDVYADNMEDDRYCVHEKHPQHRACWLLVDHLSIECITAIYKFGKTSEVS